MKLLEENNRQGQAQDLSLLMFYMDGMTRQFEAVSQELQEVRQQLAQAQESPAKKAVGRMVEALGHKVEQAREALDNLREKIMDCTKNTVENFKEAGVSALDKAMSAIGAKNALESLQEKISGMIADTKQNIEKVENIGHELRSVGGHLKNAGRAMTGKDTQTVDGGQEGRFQSVVLTPMRATKSLLSSMNNATLAAIGGMESLELSAEAAREARTERQAEKSPPSGRHWRRNGRKPLPSPPPRRIKSIRPRRRLYERQTVPVQGENGAEAGPGRSGGAEHGYW